MLNGSHDQKSEILKKACGIFKEVYRNFHSSNLVATKISKELSDKLKDYTISGGGSNITRTS